MKNIFLFIFSAIVTTIGVELFLNYTRITPPTLKYYDKVFGSLNRHDIRYFKSVEGLFIGSTNYDGRFRENYSPRKASDKTLRIMLLGDSFVEGIDVFPANHFANYIEDILSKRLNRKVEVLNCGRGNTTVHTMSYYFLNYLSKQYDADIVLYFTDGRDVADIKNAVGYPAGTLYKLDSAGNIVSYDYWKKTPDYILDQKLTRIPIIKYYDKSSYTRLLYRAIARTKGQGIGQMTFGKFVGVPREQVYTNDMLHDTLAALTCKLYDTLYKFDKGQVVFVFRNKPMYAPAIEQYIKSKNYKWINLADTFNNFMIKGTQTDAYYFKATHTYGGHWNNSGHKAVGTFLARKIFDSLGTYRMPGYSK